MKPHADDRFHPPTSDDPYWTETCWFTFAVPDRRLSGQLYPFFRPNQGVTSGACYLWDESGSQPWNVVYGKNFWHLPIPKDADLADLALPNGILYRCLDPLRRYALSYRDPDAAGNGDSDDAGRGEVAIDLEFTGICAPNYLGGSHLDQPGRYTGTIRIRDEVIAVDAFGMRDRSWGVRSQFGTTLHPGAPNERGGYSYATASERDAFHAITMDFGQGCIAIHGFLLRDGEWSKLASGKREVLERKDHCPTRVRLSGTDELGRTFEAEGRCLNRIGVHLNPNLWTWNCLTEWEWEGARGYGEDHDNWSAAGFRHFARGEGGHGG